MASSRFGNRVSLRWVLFSYATISGSLLIAVIVGNMAGWLDATSAFPLYGVASLVGGALAGMASQRKTILDSAVAGALVAIVMALLSLSLSMGHLTGEFADLRVPISVAVVSMFAAMIGAELGERLPSMHDANELFWTPLASLHCLGLAFTSSAIVGAIGDLSSTFVTVSLVLFLVFCMPPLVGVVTQLGRHANAMTSHLVSSLVLSFLFSTLIFVDQGHFEIGPFVAGLIGMMVFFGLFCSYSGFGANFAHKRGWNAPRGGDLPEAQSLAGARKL